MKHSDNRLEKPSYYIEEITLGTKPQADPGYRESVVWRRQLTEQLGSGATRVFIVDNIETLPEYSDLEPARGRIEVRIDADRPFESSYGVTTESQHTELGIVLRQDQIIAVSLGIGVPPIIDTEMEKETSDEWIKWGLTLDYKDGPTGGHLLVTPSELQMLAISQRLADIAHKTRWERGTDQLLLGLSINSQAKKRDQIFQVIRQQSQYR